MTLNALTRNKEWNVRLVSAELGEYAQNVRDEFQKLWDSKAAKPMDEVLESYRIKYELIRQQRDKARAEQVISLDSYRLTPNQMQLEFIKNLRKIRGDGEERALLISSTGTGKTYASAFAVRDENPRRVLFLVHREQILKQARQSYRKVFGTTRKMEILSGSSKDFKEMQEADFVFAMMGMMAKDEVQRRFRADAFDMIIVDEVHRAASNSYQKIMEYFKPEFWLGMTASPDRPDGYDIYALFAHNIAYEIRLQQALENDLLCPFHYFGITDLELDGEIFNNETGALKQFNRLTSDERVNYIIEKIKYFGYSGERVKGLVFCSSVEESKLLSEQFSQIPRSKLTGHQTCNAAELRGI